jgi:hypothetical protein
MKELIEDNDLNSDEIFDKLDNDWNKFDRKIKHIKSDPGELFLNGH